MYKFSKYFFNIFFYFFIVYSIVYPRYVYASGFFFPIISLFLVLLYIRIVFYIGVDKNVPFLFTTGFLFFFLDRIISKYYDSFSDFFLVKNCPALARMFLFVSLGLFYYASIVSFMFNYLPIVVNIHDFFNFVIKKVDELFNIPSASASSLDDEKKESYKDVLQMNNDFSDESISRRGFRFYNPLAISLLGAGFISFIITKSNPALATELGAFFFEKKTLSLAMKKEVINSLMWAGGGGAAFHTMWYIAVASERTNDPGAVIKSFILPDVNSDYPDNSSYLISTLDGRVKMRKLLNCISDGNLYKESMCQWERLDVKVRAFYHNDYLKAIEYRSSKLIRKE